MIDPNFLRYLIKSKAQQSETAPPEKRGQLNCEIKQAIRLLHEGPNRELIQKNSQWLRKSLSADD